MGYRIELHDEKKQCVKVPAHLGDDLGGETPHASMYVSYNYSKIFSFKKLNSRSGKDSDEMLQDLVTSYILEDRGDDIYKCTKGNVGYTCLVLLSWARLYPEATWRVT